MTPRPPPVPEKEKRKEQQLHQTHSIRMSNPSRLQIVVLSAVMLLLGRFYGDLMTALFGTAPSAALSISSGSSRKHFALQRHQLRYDANRNSTGYGQSRYSGLSIGETIVRKTFDRTYGKLVAVNCPKTQMARVCYQQFLQNQAQKANVTLCGNVLPWWFRTLLAESAIIASQWWQTLCTNGNPYLRQCQLPKVGSKQWSNFIHLMNEDGWEGPDHKNATLSWNHRGRNEEGPKFVALRDPLERYLSGFLDKCVSPNVRQKHCQPTVIFTDGRYDEPRKTTINDIKSDDRLLFDAFVHASPLKWNVHFMPQALLCDGLYRTIHEYDYILKMGPRFYSDMAGLAAVHPRVDATLVKIFDYKRKLKEEAANARKIGGGVGIKSGAGAGSSNAGGMKGIETGASDKISKFYTAATVRKVLEYMAIDYVVLDLEVPLWAEEILLKD